jgi:hypothetical protein
VGVLSNLGEGVRGTFLVFTAISFFNGSTVALSLKEEEEEEVEDYHRIHGRLTHLAGQEMVFYREL